LKSEERGSRSFSLWFLNLFGLLIVPFCSIQRYLNDLAGVVAMTDLLAAFLEVDAQVIRPKIQIKQHEIEIKPKEKEEEKSMLC
jgi:hypothetical protein